MDYTIEELPKFEDKRGFLIEFLKHSELPEGKQLFGQIYLATIKPGCLRGNHFHKEKNEYFAIMSGRVSLVVEDINTKDREEVVIESSGDSIKRIRVGANVAHAIKNISDNEVVLCAYTDKEYYADNLDQEVYDLI